MFYKLLLFFTLILFSSCSKRNLIYLNDLQQEYGLTKPIENQVDPKIQPLDLLEIIISTLNAETNLLFNSVKNEAYRVDKNGFINFPVLGKISLGGLTLDEATVKITNMLEAEAKNPIVKIKFQNFKVTLIGEVNSPNTYTVSKERINIIEAIGMAGDLTIFGQRDKIILIREIEGERTTTRLDLTSKEIFNSPYYYLQQNDIIYIQPTKARTEQGSMARSNFSLILSSLSLLSIILVLFV